jgi:hypothetical protein
MSWAYVAVGTIAAATTVYGIAAGKENARDQREFQKDQMAVQQKQQLKLEREAKAQKDRAFNEQALEDSKMRRARQQALLFGGATKNNTIKTSPTGVVPGGSLGGSSPSTGTKSLLGY